MSEVLILPTERSGVVLHELATDEDDLAYLEALQESPDHVDNFGNEVASKYRTLEDVRNRRMNAGLDIRTGILNGDRFSGSISARVDEFGVQAEVGYWLRKSAVGNGYGKLAVRTLSPYVERLFPRVFAEVNTENSYSADVLRGSNYVELRREPRFWGGEWVEADIFEPAAKPHLVTYQPKYQEGFESLIRQGHQEFGFPYDPELDEDLKHPEDFYRNHWVLEKAGEVLGSVALKTRGDSEVTLKRMYLRQQLRGQGYGRLLVATAVKSAKDDEFTKIKLDTSSKQTAAQQTYERVGFKQVSQDGNTLMYELDFETPFG